MSSAYDLLIKSFETNPPLSRNEFECALHAEPTIEIFWNNIDAYVNTNYNHLKLDKSKDWLIEWRDTNCPRARVAGLLKIRIDQGIKELTQELIQAHVNLTDDDKKETIIKGIKILNEIKSQSSLGVSGKRLLLEAAVLTPKVILHPEDTTTCERYSNLAKKIHIEHPRWQTLCGLMLVIVGVLSGSKKRFESGMATFKAAWHAGTRSIIQEDMSNIPVKPEDSVKPKR